MQKNLSLVRTSKLSELSHEKDDQVVRLASSRMLDPSSSVWSSLLIILLIITYLVSRLVDLNRGMTVDKSFCPIGHQNM